MIKERYCSYEVTRLLKEKGFDEECHHIYVGVTLEWTNTIYGDDVISNNEISDVDTDVITAPTHQMACDWLGDIHDLYIIAYPYKRGNIKGWCCYVYKTYNLLGQERYMNETCNSCYEAIEAALKYSLENLV